jgi:hypothetical protein
MGRPALTVQEWFLLNQEELIHCPNQVGNLKITRSSCRKRRLRSSEWVYGTTPDNYIRFAFERHLLVCRQCDQMEPGDSDPGQDVYRLPRTGRPPKDRYEQRELHPLEKERTEDRQVQSD